MSFNSLTERNGPSNAINATRLKRQLVEQAIGAATAADWAEAAAHQRAHPRVRSGQRGREPPRQGATGSWASWPQRASTTRRPWRSIRPAASRSATSTGFALLMAEAGRRTVPAKPGSKAPVSIFVEETGKTGFAHLVDLATPRDLAQVNPGDAVDLLPDGPRLAAISNGMPIGVVEPRVAARLLKLIAEGNKYAAGVTSLGDKDVRIIIREVYQDPRNYGKVSFPTAAKVSDLRPVHEGHAGSRGDGPRGRPRDRRRGRRDRGHRLGASGRGDRGGGVRGRGERGPRRPVADRRRAGARPAPRSLSRATPMTRPIRITRRRPS